MNKGKEIILKQRFLHSEVDAFCTKRDWLILQEDAEIAIRIAVKDTIKRIEDSKLSRLGNTIEQIKREYE